MTALFDEKTYFDLVRADPFKGSMTQAQVDGQKAILSGWERDHTRSADLRWLAYMLATTFHETAQKMQPIIEYGGESYLKSKPYYPYYGRGFVQLTWSDNYKRATDELELQKRGIDLVKTPDKALDPDIAYDVMDRGMSEGWFRSKQLSDYFNSVADDPVNARDIINGDVSTMGPKVAGYHKAFLAALEAAFAPAGDDDLVEVALNGKVVAALTVPRGDLAIAVNGQGVYTR